VARPQYKSTTFWAPKLHHSDGQGLPPVCCCRPISNTMASFFSIRQRLPPFSEGFSVPATCVSQYAYSFETWEYIGYLWCIPGKEVCICDQMVSIVVLIRPFADLCQRDAVFIDWHFRKWRTNNWRKFLSSIQNCGFERGRTHHWWSRSSWWTRGGRSAYEIPLVPSLSA
jgi:hypothetical protein